MTSFASCGTLVFGPLAPFLVEDLAIGYAAVGGLTSAVFLGAAVASPRAGRWADRLGAGPALTLALLLMGGFLALGAVPAGYAGLLGVALLVGAAFGLVNPAANAVVGASFDPRRRGAAMGVKQTGIAAGGILAGVWLPGVAIAFGWRTALVQVAAALVLAAIFSAFVLGRPRRGEPGRRVPAPTAASPRALPLWVGGFLLSGAQGLLIAYVVLFALERGAFTAAAAGALFAAVQSAALVGRVALGAVSDHVFGGRRRPVLVACALLGAVALGALAVTGTLAAKPPLAAAAVLGGLSVIGWNGVYMAALVDPAPAAAHGAASGVGVGFNLAGVVVFPLAGGLALDAGAGYEAVWIGAAFAALVAAVAFALHGEPAAADSLTAESVAKLSSPPTER